METRVCLVNHPAVEDTCIAEAARLLKQGEVVAFPTETVYGLGANALNPKAVSRIYEAKGRPAHNPLIVHVATIDQARELVTDWPEAAQQLAEAFWPGPLTIVLEKAAGVPDITTAGGPTVAIRIPAHPVARALIQACGFPLAAPSANPSNYISPTTARHVMTGLAGRIPLVVDGGPCEAGIESTVVAIASGSPSILRPGIVTAEQLHAVTGLMFTSGVTRPAANQVLASPGQLETHYSPRTKLLLVSAGELDQTIEAWRNKGKHFAIIGISDRELVPGALSDPPEIATQIILPNNPTDYARQIYATLHELDSLNLDVILCKKPPETSDWAGVTDRLRRASQK